MIQRLRLLYVLDLRQRLKETCDWAQVQLRVTSSRHKKNFDRRAKVRLMKVGDLALVFLPTKSNKLLMRWKGPFTIVEVFNCGMDCRLNLGR
jgi:hypothetical protein